MFECGPCQKGGMGHFGIHPPLQDAAPLIGLHYGLHQFDHGFAIGLCGVSVGVLKEPFVFHLGREAARAGREFPQGVCEVSRGWCGNGYCRCG